MRVLDLAPNRWVVWGDALRLTTWTWVLQPAPDGTTRLLTRIRVGPSWRHR